MRVRWIKKRGALRSKQFHFQHVAFIMNYRKLILSMQITLDGYISGPKDEADWLISSDEEWVDHFEDIHSADTFLLGRKMYPLYSQYWQSVLNNPDARPNELEFA